MLARAKYKHTRPTFERWVLQNNISRTTGDTQSGIFYLLSRLPMHLPVFIHGKICTCYGSYTHSVEFVNHRPLLNRYFLDHNMPPWPVYELQDLHPVPSAPRKLHGKTRNSSNTSHQFSPLLPPFSTLSSSIFATRRLNSSYWHFS